MVASSGLCAGIECYIGLSHPMRGEIRSSVVVLSLPDVVGRITQSCSECEKLIVIVFIQ